MTTATETEQSRTAEESDDSKRIRLADAVRELVMLKRDADDTQKRISVVSDALYKLAVHDLKLIGVPPRYNLAGEKFCCDGFLVTVGAKEYDSCPPKVTVAEIGHLPHV